MEPKLHGVGNARCRECRVSGMQGDEKKPTICRPIVQKGLRITSPSGLAYNDARMRSTPLEAAHIAGCKSRFVWGVKSDLEK